jgi:4-hydroxy-tetrahydrodipicolinate synthase
MMFKGAMTAMVTPFNGGSVDVDRLREHVEFQIDKGIDALVPVGTTGESPTLSHDEHNLVVDTVVKATNGRVPVIAGTGSNSTAEAVAMTKHAAEVGANGSLQVCPYYNKPSQEGMYRHFMTIADEAQLPLILYNIPGRTGITMSAATIARLSQHEHIVGVKEATGSLDMTAEIAALVDPTEFAILSGDDSLTLPIMAAGGSGVISVLSNIIPDQIAGLAADCLAGDFGKARATARRLYPLFKGMFIETNPVPVKAAMAMMGRDTGEVRLPICQMDQDTHAVLDQLLKAHDLL